MLASHCGMCRVWVAAWSICFTLLQQGSSCIHLGHEVYGIGIVGSFIQDNENKMFIPDPATKKDKVRCQTCRIRNGMDESEASKAQKRCRQCGALGHNYKKCSQNALTMLLTSVLPKIPEMEHLLRSDDHRRELLVEGTRCHDPPVCSLYLYTNRAWSLYQTYL